jgi:hypothetical protein
MPIGLQMMWNKLHKAQGHSGYGNHEKWKGTRWNTYADGVLEVHLVGSEDGNRMYWRELLVLLRLGVIGTGTECSVRVVGPVLL